MVTCLIMFRDKADGTLEIEAQHEGVFDLNIKSHAALDAVVKMLPMVFTPVQAEPEHIASVTMKNEETGQEMMFSDDGSSFLNSVPDPGKWVVTKVDKTEPVIQDAPIVSTPVLINQAADEVPVEIEKPLPIDSKPEASPDQEKPISDPS